MRRSTAGAVLGLVIALTILLLAGTGEAQSGLSISVHATGFTTPVAVVQDPTNRAVQFVVEQGGRMAWPSPARVCRLIF